MTQVEVYRNTAPENGRKSATAPLVSVIIPTRNRAALLSRSVASVLNQTYTHVEVIVINDASTDRTRELLESLEDSRLVVINNERNCGAAAARNCGISQAKGDLIAFQDDDDIWLAQKLEQQVEALTSQESRPALCLCGFIEISSEKSRYVGGEKFMDELDFSRGNGMGGPDYSMIATPGWLTYKSTLVNAGGFDERLQSWDDWELALRMTHQNRIVVVDEPLYIKDHLEGKGLMLNHLGRVADMRIIMKKHAEIWAKNPEVQRQHYYYMGQISLQYDPTPGAGRKELAAVLRYSPFNLKYRVQYLMTFLERKLSMRLFDLYRRCIFLIRKAIPV